MRLNKKGFTLIELLVTIVIIGLVVGFSTYGIIKILGNSEEEATVLSESSLREAARIYSSEVGSDSWKNANTYDAFCVTVGELMNKGLLDKKATTPDGIDRNTFIIVKRNKVTLSVEEEEIVSDIVDTENNKICTGQVTEEGEEYTLPKVSGHDSYTDKLIINFEGGSASYQGSSSTINYKCLYGESSSNINKEGKIVGNNCEIDNLKNADEDNKKIEYYVRIYMNTNHGTSVLAEDENESYTLANFIAPEITKNNWTANITYTDKDSNNHDINPAYHYFKSTINGTSNVDVVKCEYKNNTFTCGNSTKTIEKNTWYKVNSNTVTISYSNEENKAEVSARIYDKSNNYVESKKDFTKYTVRFYKNTASSIDGSTNEYVEKYCVAEGNNTCKITSPQITASTGYSAIGWNTSSTATSSTWNINAEKNINSNTNYYAIIKANTYTITYNLNGGSVSGNPTSYNVETSTFTLKNPTRSGYTFTGWTGSNGNTPQTIVTINKGSTGNKSYTANWSAKNYTYNIVYKSSSGIQLGTSTVTKQYGTTNTISPKAYTGYTSPSSQSVKWDSTSAKTITFTYTPVSYSISYTLNGGSVSGNPTSYNIETNTFTLKNPTRSGYTFTGWTGSNGSTPQTTVTISKGSTGNKSYTANWQSNTIIKYVNTLAGLNCRSTPIIGEVITAYSCGTRLEGNDSSTSGWFYYPGNNCYLSNEFLSTTVPNCGSSGDSSDDGNNTRCGYCETKLDCTGGSGGTCTGTCRDSQGDYPCCSYSAGMCN